jgi:hypothetical protein
VQPGAAEHSSTVAIAQISFIPLLRHAGSTIGFREKMI